MAVPATLPGLGYYATPFQERPFVPGHDLFAPSALVGHGYGILGALMMVVGVVGYTARKRMPFLRSVGRINAWLQVHIFLCTLGPYLVLLHTTFKFGGVVSIAFWSMAVVVVSGVFGRYVYAHIPKTVQGGFLGLEAIQGRIAELGEELRGRTDRVAEELLRVASAEPALPGGTPGLTGAMVLALRSDLESRRHHRRLRRSLRGSALPRPLQRDILRLSRERHRLRRQVLVVRPFQRLFRYWHLVHLPLALTMAVVVVVHVGVAVAFGYTWIW